MKYYPFIYGVFLGVVLLTIPWLSASEVTATPPVNPPTSADSSTKRLLTLQKVLRGVLDEVTKTRANPDSAFLDGPIADLKEALDDTAQALAYIKAHPESDTLLVRPVRADWPALIGKNGMGLAGVRADSAFSSLRSGEQTLINSEIPFLIGDSVNGYQIMNDLGGHRDKILREMDTADALMVKGVIDISRRGIARYAGQSEPDSPATHAPAGKGGSISGTVLDIHGQPAAFAAISIHLQKELDRNGRSVNWSEVGRMGFPGGVLVTIADANGAFTIKDLPPDSYVVSAEMTNGAQNQTITHAPVVVKAGEDTKLAEPMQMFSMGMGIGG